MHEVERPSFVWHRDDRWHVAATQRHSSFNALPHLKIGLGVNSVDPLVICNYSVPSQKDVKSAIPEAPSFGGKFLKPLKKRFVVAALKYAPKRFAITNCGGTGFALTQPDLFYHRPSSSPPLRGRQKFPEAIGFSASISSAESASNLLSRRFSTSSVHIFATSLSSMPPNFDFHL